MSITLLHINIFALECSWSMFGTEGIPWGNPKTAKDEGNQIGSSYKSKTLKECKDLCNEQVRDGCQSFRFCNLATKTSLTGKAYGLYSPTMGECYLFDKVLTGNEKAKTKDDCYTKYFHCTGNNLNNQTTHI